MPKPKSDVLLLNCAICLILGLVDPSAANRLLPFWKLNQVPSIVLEYDTPHTWHVGVSSLSLLPRMIVVHPRRNRLKQYPRYVGVCALHLCVLNQIRARGFGKLEFTLQSIEGEQDVDRLHRSELERTDREEALEMQGITQSIRDIESAMTSTSTRPSSSLGLNLESDTADDDEEDDPEPEFDEDEESGAISDIGIMSSDEDL